VTRGFPPGTRVKVRVEDPPTHTRAPRYVRGHHGVVVETHGWHRVPDDVVGGVVDPQPQPVYAVRFAARELWGAGDHSVTVNLWHCYLEPEGSA
jgi:nitrile hydratase